MVVAPAVGDGDRVAEFVADLIRQTGQTAPTLVTDLPASSDAGWTGDIIRHETTRGASWTVRLGELLSHAGNAWVLVVEPGARLSGTFLPILQRHIAAQPGARLLHGDFDHLGADGSRSRPVMVPPRWDEDLALQVNLLRGWIALKPPVGGLPSLFDGPPSSALYQIGLAVSVGAEDTSVVHVPHVLAHLTVADAPDETAAYDTIRGQALARRGLDANLGAGPSRATHRFRFLVPEPAPKISVIIPTRDGGDLLATCLDGVRSGTDYGALEIIVVDNGSENPRTLRTLSDLDGDPRCRVIRHDQPFNFSEIINLAVSQSTGSLICLLNDDIRVLDRTWLREMAGLALRPDVGIVGALLLFEDGRVQHAGVTLGLLGHVAGHDFHYQPEAELRRHVRFAHVHQTSAVTAACAVLRRDVYDGVGGMEPEHLAVNYNDLDLCLKIGATGLKVLWTPFARLVHAESATRGKDERVRKFALSNAEGGYIASKWPQVHRRDPSLNPNLSLEHPAFGLSFVVAVPSAARDPGDQAARERVFATAREIARTADILPENLAFHAAKAAHHLKLDDLAARLTLEAVLQTPDAYTANLVAGTCLSRVGELEQARFFFRCANRISPQAVRPWLYLGLIAEQLGEPAEAVQILSTVLTHDPFNKQATAALESLKPGVGPGAR